MTQDSVTSLVLNSAFLTFAASRVSERYFKSNFYFFTTLSTSLLSMTWSYPSNGITSGAVFSFIWPYLQGGVINALSVFSCSLLYLNRVYEESENVWDFLSSARLFRFPGFWPVMMGVSKLMLVKEMTMKSENGGIFLLHQFCRMIFFPHWVST